MGLLALLISVSFANCSLPEGQSFNVFVKSASHDSADIRIQDTSNAFFVRHYIDKDGVIGLRVAVMGVLKMNNDDYQGEDGKRANAFLQNRLNLLAKHYDVSELRKAIGERSELAQATAKFLANVKASKVDVRDSDQDDEKTKKIDALTENLPYTGTTCKTVLNTFEVDEAYGLMPETRSLEKVVTVH